MSLDDPIEVSALAAAQPATRLGLAAVPPKRDRLTVMGEVSKVELESTVGAQPDDPPHGVAKGRRAVGGQAHDLVLVAVAPEAEEPRDRLVEQAEGVGKQNLTVALESRPTAGAPMVTS